MNPSSTHSYSRIIGLSVLGILLLLLDIFSKAYIAHIFALGHAWVGNLSFPIFQDFFGIDFNISLATNRGAAWGILANFQTILIVLRIFAIAGMLIYLCAFNRNRWVEIPLILIVSGALGNVADFFLYGYVVDFLHFNLWGYDFPIFNLADTFISVGVFWLLLFSTLHKKMSRSIPKHLC